MRIISGKYKGRNLKGFDIDGTRPTMNRVKESLFAMIQEKIENSVCLDLFAGSGNLGIEALSNGAKECVFVDYNRVAVQTIKENLATCHIENALVYQMDYQKALAFLKEQKFKFDIVFLDPPYASCFINPILKYLNEYDLLSEKGIIVCEYEKEKVNTDDFSILKERKYGSKSVTIYHKSNVKK